MYARLRSLSRVAETSKTLCRLLLFAAALPILPSMAFAQDSLWVRPQHPGDPLVWGRRDGVVFGLKSEGGLKGPRGLIRIGVIRPGSDKPELLNYVAIEPVVAGPGRRFDRLAFSELEMSEFDQGERGKEMWVDNATSPDSFKGTLQSIQAGRAKVERLSVRINVERYSDNGAHVFVVASIDSDRPKEVRFSVFTEPDSTPLDDLTVTATMGNYERLRLLWLQDHVVNSRKLFASYTGDAFTEGESYPLPDMLRTGDGDAVVYCTSDEPNPQTSPGNATAHWPYTLPKFTQYWRVPGHDVEPDLRVRVNARRVYWASTSPVLDGVAFENFEVRQRFVSGQTFIFGIDEKEPWTLYSGTTHLSAYEPHPPVGTEATNH